MVARLVKIFLNLFPPQKILLTFFPPAKYSQKKIARLVKTLKNNLFKSINIPKSFPTQKNVLKSFSNTIIWTMYKILKIFNKPATLVKNYKQKRVDEGVDKGDMKGNLEKLNIFRN